MVSGRIGLGSGRLICRLDGEERERKERQKERGNHNQDNYWPLFQKLVFFNGLYFTVLKERGTFNLRNLVSHPNSSLCQYKIPITTCPG